MKRTVYKWALGISLVLLILNLIYFVFMTALANLVGGTWLFLMEDALHFERLTLTDSLRASVGSPWFYGVMVDLGVLAASVIALTLTRKSKMEEKP